MKGILCGMIERSIIYDGGKGGLESFYVTAEQEVMTCDVSRDVCGNTTNNNESVSASVNMDTSLGAGNVDMENASVDQGKFFENVSTNILNNNSENNLVENSEYLITQKLHKMALIKHQVKHELNLLSDNNLLSIKSNNVN